MRYTEDPQLATELIDAIEGQLAAERAEKTDDRPHVSELLYCTDPNMRVLTADLRWIKVCDLRPGQELIGFDETLKGTRFKPSIVQELELVHLPTYKIITTDGDVIVSADHLWPAKH